MTFRSEGVVIFVGFFMLLLVAFTIKVFTTLPAAYEEKLERLCAPKKESQWAFTAPPMEKNNVWIDAKASTEKVCKSRKESDGTIDSS